MSYIAFGTISHIELNGEELEKLSWDILKKGIENRLYVMFEPNISQSIIKEMLNEQASLENNQFRFFISASPLCDTTDSLISPSHFGKNDFFSVFNNLILFNEWIKEVLAYDEILKIRLFLTEGYDDNFKLVRTDVNGMHGVLKKIINEYNDIPSIIMEIDK